MVKLLVAVTPVPAWDGSPEDSENATNPKIAWYLASLFRI
jgi:hypothetical protein